MNTHSKLLPFNDTHASLFKDVVFIVEADSFANLELWRNHFHNPIHENSKITTWEQVNPGKVITIGHCADSPVCVEVFYNILNGKKVMFYHASSSIVDYGMVEEWISHYGVGIHSCDAMNFHQCISVVRG